MFVAIGTRLAEQFEPGPCLKLCKAMLRSRIKEAIRVIASVSGLR